MRTLTPFRLALLLAGLLFASTAAAFQDPQSRPATTGASDDLTVEVLDTRLQAVRANADLDEAAKTRLAELYQQAIDALKLAADWESHAAEFERLRKEAPTRLELIRAELAQPAEEPKIDVPADASLQQLEQRLAQAEAELKAARDNAASLDDEGKRRAARRAELPAAITTAKQRLDAVSQELETPPSKDDSAELTAARQVSARTRRRAAQAEIQSYEAETASYDARGELITARRDQAGRTVTRNEAIIKAWQEVVNERRRMEAQTAAQAAAAARREAARANPVVRPLIEENAVWAERRAKDRLADKIEQATQDLDQVKQVREKLKTDSTSVKSKVNAAGLTNAIGLLLRRQRDTLPPIQTHQRAIETRQSRISEVQVELIELDDARTELAGAANDIVQGVLATLAPGTSAPDRAEVETAARELLNARRDYIQSLRNDYDSYFGKLVELDSEQRALLREIDTYSAYIDERILWIRSTAPPQYDDLVAGLGALAWITRPHNWLMAGDSLVTSIRHNPAPTGGCIVILAILVIAQRRLRRLLRHYGDAAVKSYAHDFAPTLLALVVTLAIAGVWPLVLWVVGAALAAPYRAPQFAQSLGFGLQTIAIFYFVAEVLRQTCRPHGLARAHFGWTQRAVRVVRTNVNWLLVSVLPAAFIVAMLESTGEDAWQNSLGRAAFVLIQLLGLVFMYRVFRPHRGALHETLKKHPTGWLNRLRFVWYTLALALPAALAVLAVLGYYYTALRLARVVHVSTWLILALSILNSLALRWLVVERRRIAIEQWRKRRDAQSEQGSVEIAEEMSTDWSTIGAQTRNIVRSVVAFCLIIGLWLAWEDVLPALGILDQVELGWTTVERVQGQQQVPNSDPIVVWTDRTVPVTLKDLGLALIIFLATAIATANLPGLLEITLLQRLPLVTGVRYAVSTVSAYLITIIGIVLGFEAIGIGWSKVQWLVAAVGVGLGFGLQEIFANFISGLIILFERPVRVGDVVTVGDVDGKVTNIKMRATTILDWDMREMVVPNKEFITGRLINWTLSDPTTRVTLAVGIAYGSDTRLAHELLLKVAGECPQVLKEPPPHALFRRFGDSTLDFELRVFIASRDLWPALIHDLHTRVDQAFRAANIEIAFPQRDLHVRSIDGELPVTQRRRARTKVTPSIPERDDASISS